MKKVRLTQHTKHTLSQVGTNLVLGAMLGSLAFGPPSWNTATLFVQSQDQLGVGSHFGKPGIRTPLEHKGKRKTKHYIIYICCLGTKRPEVQM